MIDVFQRTERFIMEKWQSPEAGIKRQEALE